MRISGRLKFLSDNVIVVSNSTKAYIIKWDDVQLITARAIKMNKKELTKGIIPFVGMLVNVITKKFDGEKK